MPLDLRQLANRSAHVSVPFGEAGTVEADYRPDLLTGDVQARVIGAARAADFGPFYDEMSKLLVGWDVVDGGQPVPTTPAGLATVGMEVVRKVWQAIQEDAADPKAVTLRTTPPTPSSNGSPPASSVPPTSPTTSSASSAPVGSDSTPPTSPDSATPATSLAGATGSAASGGPSSAPTPN